MAVIEVSHAILGIPALPTGPKLGLRIHPLGLAAIDFVAADVADIPPATDLGNQIKTELVEYFANPAWEFSLPLLIDGTPFQQQVWRALRRIPVGTVCSYGELARNLRTGARAIGNACRTNPLPIIIPCHRVVGMAYRSAPVPENLPNPGIGGYSGHTQGEPLAFKRWLLAHEARS